MGAERKLQLTGRREEGAENGKKAEVGCPSPGHLTCAPHLGLYAPKTRGGPVQIESYFLKSQRCSHWLADH